MASDALSSVREPVLTVAHERDIADQAQRVVTLLDGLVSSDTMREAA